MRRDEGEEDIGDHLHRAPLAALLSGTAGLSKSACGPGSVRCRKAGWSSPGSANSPVCSANWKPSRTANPSLGKHLLKPPLGLALG